MKRVGLFTSWLVCLLAVIALVTIVFQTSTEARASKRLTARLTAIAKAYLVARSQVLVYGESATVLPESLLTPSYQDIFQGSVERLLSGHKMMIDESTPYTSFTTEVKVDKVEMRQETIILKATEHTKLGLGGDDPLTPEFTESFPEHIFTFIRDENNQWILVKDEVPFEPGLSEPREENEVTEPFLPTPLSPEYQPEFQNDQKFQALTLANRSVIVNYAYTYVYSYNSSYRRFNNDCTNFISQAVRAGGWQFESSWPDWWYYWWGQSRTWVNSHEWFWFTYNRSRAALTYDINYLQPGDILQVDWVADGFGTINHSMVVTKKDDSGIYLTYHSNDTRDKKFSKIQQENPNSRFYGWRLY